MRRSKSKLLTQVLLRVLPIAATILVAVWYGASSLLSEKVREELAEGLTREAQFGAETISSKLETVHSIMAAIASNDLVLNGLVDVEDRASYIPVYFRSLKMPGAAEALIAMTDYRGRIIASNTPGATIADMTWLAPVMRGEDYFDIRNDRLIMAVPIIYQGYPEGAIFLEYSNRGVADRLSIASVSGIYSVIKNKTVLHASSQPFGLASVDDTAGKWISARSHVPDHPELTVVVGQKAELALRTIGEIDDMMLELIAAALMVLGGGIVFAAYLATKPLSRFRDEIHEIAGASDLDYKVEGSGSAEFQDLALEFNTMLNRLRTTVVSNDRLAEENKIRRATETALRDSERRHITIVQGLPQPIYIYRDGEMVFANTAFQELFGDRTAVEVLTAVGFTPDEQSPAGSEQSEDDAAVLTNDSGKGIQRNEFRYDGSENSEPRWFENITRTIHWDGRAAIEGIFVEITERKRVEKVKDEFVSVVSHELRTPLTAMIGALGLASSGGMGELPEKAGGMVKLARRNAERLVGLVNDILDLDKIAAGEMTIHLEEMELISFVRETIAEIESYGEQKSVSFVVETEVDQIQVNGDRQRLGQILMNLLSNAEKFSPLQGRVTLRILALPEATRIEVSDNGPGIAVAMHEKIFNKFFQVDGSDTRAIQGTGLGLSISQALAERHGSTIAVRSELGNGATFYFDLPLLKTASPAGGQNSGQPDGVDNAEVANVA